MTVVEETRPFAQQLSNVYFTILSLFCFKLFVKISLAILSHFYIVKGNRKEAARIAAEFYGIPQGQDFKPVQMGTVPLSRQSSRDSYWTGTAIQIISRTSTDDMEALAGSQKMSTNVVVEKNSITKNRSKRGLDFPGEPPLKQRAKWGILTSQGSWADRSPLHEAASQGRLLSLKTLITQGYNVDALTIDHVTPLHEACLGDHEGCARLLLEAGANVNARTIDGMTPLFNACSSGSASCVQLLLEYGAKIQWETCLPSPSHEAASRGHSDCLELLISWGIEVDQNIPHLGTPLYVACISQQKQCVHKLLHSGANVQKGKFLETPLHAAARLSNTEIINILLEFGADINAKNTESERPVDVAVSSSLVEKILLLHEVTPYSLCQLCRLQIRNYIGKSRLHLIPQLQLPNILKTFLQYR